MHATNGRLIEMLAKKVNQITYSTFIFRTNFITQVAC